MIKKIKLIETPQKCLFEAARTGDVDLFFWSLRHGADLNVRTMPGHRGFSVSELAHNYCQDVIAQLIKRVENSDALASRSFGKGKGGQEGEGYGEPL